MMRKGKRRSFLCAVLVLTLLVTLVSGAVPVNAAGISITSIRANRTSANTGDTISWTATATGGRGALRYCFYIYRNGNAVWKGSYGTARTVNYTVTSAGTYTAKVFVKDGVGSSASKMSTGISVSGSTVPLSVAGVRANKSSASVGDAITWSATASGGSGTLKYCFYVYRNGSVVWKGSYSTARSAVYTPTAAGTYTAKVFVKDGSGASASRLSGGVKVAAPQVSLAVTGVKASLLSANVGDTITWTATATGGTGTLKYCFYVYRNGAVAWKGSYGTSKSFTYTFDASGTYTVKAFVKDSVGASASKMSNTVTVAGAVTALSVSRISASRSSATPGETIVWTATAAGGVGTVKYCFYIYKDGSLVKKGVYSTTARISYTPTETGSYTAKVFLKDEAGNTANKVSAATLVSGHA